MTRQWVGVAANASSGRGRGRPRVDRLARALETQGLDVRIAWTPEDRRSMVADSNQDGSCRCLVAAGGDGTVAALINDSPRCPVTVLPSGTENLFARNFRMVDRPDVVARTIAAGRTMAMDVGLTGDRRFVLMAGIGFDADVVNRHHAARVGLTGSMRPTSRVAYVEPVLRSSFEYQFPALRIMVSDPGREEELIGTTAFVFNLPRYALNLPIAPTALGDDGMLDLIVFRNPGALHALHYLWMVFRGLHLRREGVYHRRVRRVTVSSASAVPIQLDGDPGGSLSIDSQAPPWGVEVLPRALTVMVPESYISPAAIA